MNSIAAGTKTTVRIPWVDVAKGLGIALVFYGHLVEQFRGLGVPGAAAEMKWIYSFHMPMFFVLVGLVYKDRDLPLAGFIKRQILTRLVPVWIFNLVGMVIEIATNSIQAAPGWVGQQGWLAASGHYAIKAAQTVLCGLPTWNFLTWFVICLFVVELAQFGLRTRLRRNRYLVISIVCFGVLTVAMQYLRPALVDIYGERIHWWRVSSAITGVFCYQLGILVRRSGWLSANVPTALRCVLGVLCLGATLLALHLDRNPVVLMAGAQYGDVRWFFVTTLTGTAFIIFLSQLLAGSRVLNYVGKITLALMCLDGILHESVNASLARLIIGWIPEPNVWTLTAICVAVTVASIAVCLPIIWALERYLPIVVGRARSRPATTG